MEKSVLAFFAHQLFSGRLFRCLFFGEKDRMAVFADHFADRSSAHSVCAEKSLQGDFLFVALYQAAVVRALLACGVSGIGASSAHRFGACFCLFVFVYARSFASALWGTVRTEMPDEREDLSVFARHVWDCRFCGAVIKEKRWTIKEI